MFPTLITAHCCILLAHPLNNHPLSPNFLFPLPSLFLAFATLSLPLTHIQTYHEYKNIQYVSPWRPAHPREHQQDPLTPLNIYPHTS